MFTIKCLYFNFIFPILLLLLFSPSCFCLTYFSTMIFADIIKSYGVIPSKVCHQMVWRGDKMRPFMWLVVAFDVGIIIMVVVVVFVESMRTPNIFLINYEKNMEIWLANRICTHNSDYPLTKGRKNIFELLLEFIDNRFW